MLNTFALEGAVFLYLLFLAVISIVPGILWVWYFARNDRHPEPLPMLVRAFIAGILSVVPAGLLEQPLRTVLVKPAPVSVGILLALVAVGVIEEGVKLGATYIAVFRSSEFDEVADGIVYAVTVALGFAAIENLFYTATFGLSVALLRAVVTSLAHASFAGVFGFWLGLYRMGHTGHDGLGRGFVVASGLHAFYDYIVMSRAFSPVIALLLVYGVYRYVMGKLRELSTHGILGKVENSPIDDE